MFELNASQCVTASLLRHPPASAAAWFALPLQAFQHGGDATLFGGPQLWSLDAHRIAGNLGDRDPRRLLPMQIVFDKLFPGVGLVARLLFRLDVLLLKLRRRPPALPSAVARDGFGEKLVAILLQ